VFASIPLDGCDLDRRGGRTLAEHHAGGQVVSAILSLQLKDKVLLEIALFTARDRQKLEPGFHPLRHMAIKDPVAGTFLDLDGLHRTVRADCHDDGYCSLLALFQRGLRVSRIGVRSTFRASHPYDCATGRFRGGRRRSLGELRRSADTW